MTRKCGNCEYFVGRTKRPKKGFKVIYGTCNRFPPMIANRWEDRFENIWVPAGFLQPKVHSKMWCGEFKKKGAKDNEVEPSTD